MNSPAHRRAFTFFTFLSLTCLASLHAEVVIARNGKPAIDIALSEHAPPSLLFAARILQTELQHVTGAQLEITTSPEGDQPHIFIQQECNTDNTSLGPDGIHLYTEQNNLYLVGQGTRGPLYAVAELLDGVIGCRYWTPDAIDRPDQPDLVIKDIDSHYAPTFEYRYPFWTEGFATTWSILNKANGYEGLQAEQFGGNRSHGGVHTFNKYIPPAAYFDQHPEWFSLIGGNRSADHTQLCLTNEEMKAELIKNLKKDIGANPSEHVFSVSQNDWFNYCQCPDCKAIDEENGSPSGTMITFVNDVAEAVEKEHPGVSISTLAYQYTRKPPAKVRPRKNVIIQLCSIECSFSVPLTDPRNQAFADDIIGWSAIADRLYIWDYTTNFRHYLLPHPNLKVLGPNLRFFAEHNVRGVFEQGAYTTAGAEFGALRAWVLARLLWNPALDDQALITEFCRGYYGAAGDDVLEYIGLLHHAAEKSGEPAYCLPSYASDFPFLSFLVLRQAFMLFQKAEEKAESPEILQRVQRAGLPVQYAFILRWEKLKDEAGDQAFPFDESREELAARFEKQARELGITRLNEWQNGFGLLQQIMGK